MTNSIGAPSMTMRVLTLNVWAYLGPAERQAVMREGIADLRPDLITLQEVHRDAERDQLAELLADTGLHTVHDRDLLDVPTMGNALASRWQPTKVAAYPLPGQPIGPDGIRPDVIAATIPLPIGVDMLVLAVKPSYQFCAEADRCAQALVIADLDAESRQPAPTIIAGDFDATPDNECMRFYAGRAVLDGRSVHYRDAWVEAGDGGPGYTWTTQNAGVASHAPSGWIQVPHHRRIDYVLVGSPEVHTSVRTVIRSCQVVLTEPLASDHYGVLAEIELTLEPPEAIEPDTAPPAAKD